MEDNFDTILTRLGTGKWTILYVVAMSYWYLLLPYTALAGAFMAPYIEHTCRLPPTAALTPTHELISNATRGMDGSCSFMVEDNVTGLLEEQPCTEWDFDNSTFTSTITSEFQLVCGSKYLQATYQSIFMFGMVMGAACNSFFADRYGRWSVIAISTVCYSIISLVSAWITSLSAILVARFLLGAMELASIQIGFTLVLEVTEIKMRSKIGLTQFLSWSVGTMLYGAWAYLVRDWRYLQIAVSIPSFFFLPALWLMGESPRWLAVVGQHERALKVLKKAARWNKVTLQSDQELLKIMSSVQSKAVWASSASVPIHPVRRGLKKILDFVTVLFRTPKMRIITVIMSLNLFAISMLYYGLTLGAATLGVDPFVYMAISGAVELPGKLLGVVAASYCGRKKIIIVNWIIIAAVLLVQPLIPRDLVWLSVVFVMVGKMAIACVFDVFFLYTLELNPTEIRSQGMGMSQISARLGSFIAPYIMSALDATYPWTVSVVFGIMAVIAGVAVLPLWETLNTRLPDTVAELEFHKDNLPISESDAELRVDLKSGAEETFH